MVEKNNNNNGTLANGCSVPTVATANLEVPDSNMISSESRKRNAWEAHFSQLAKFKSLYGHCYPKMSDNPRLYHWCYRQKKTYQNENYEQDKYQKLLELGFDFMYSQSIKDSGGKRVLVPDTPTIPLFSGELSRPGYCFERRFQDLQKYKRKHKTVQVRFSVDKSLSRWIQRTRKAYREGRLDNEKIQKLTSLGLEWDLSSQKLTDNGDPKTTTTTTTTTTTNNSKKINIYTPPRANVPPLIVKKVTPLRMTVFTHHLDELIHGLGTGQMQIDQALEKLREMRRIN